MTNQKRADNGLAALGAEPGLQRAAQNHSDDMAHGGFFDHTGSSGDTLSDRVSATHWLQPGRSFTAGENIAWVPVAMSTPAAMIADWMASPDHRANILDPGFRQTGFGVSVARPAGYNGNRAGIAVTEDFGSIQ